LFSASADSISCRVDSGKRYIFCVKRTSAKESLSCWQVVTARHPAMMPSPSSKLSPNGGGGGRARVARALRRITRIAKARAPSLPVTLVILGLLAYIALSGRRRDQVISVSNLGDLGPGVDEADTEADGLSAGLIGGRDDAVRRAAAAAAMRGGNLTQASGVNGGLLGNRFCVMQPTLSAGKTKWTAEDARGHIAIRAFLRTFADTVTAGERESMKFAIYYGHDSDDPVFGDEKLRGEFEGAARKLLEDKGFGADGVDLVFTPLYGLHGRVNAIWNVMAKDAYYDGCDYFFMSNDDMVFFTPGWVAVAVQSLDGRGSPAKAKRPCRHFGTVRFKDEWASWATFTFHVSTRLHLDIFGGTYYPVPYNSAHNDYWIHMVYKGFDASKFRGSVKVRNRVDDVDYALANPKDTKHIAPPRYEYDKRGDAMKYIRQGRARVRQWLRDNPQHSATGRCLTPL
jgi:hypothetical protein